MLMRRDDAFLLAPMVRRQSESVLLAGRSQFEQPRANITSESGIWSVGALRFHRYHDRTAGDATRTEPYD